MRYISLLTAKLSRTETVASCVLNRHEMRCNILIEAFVGSRDSQILDSILLVTRVASQLALQYSVQLKGVCLENPFHTHRLCPQRKLCRILKETHKWTKEENPLRTWFEWIKDLHLALFPFCLRSRICVFPQEILWPECVLRCEACSVTCVATTVLLLHNLKDTRTLLSPPFRKTLELKCLKNKSFSFSLNDHCSPSKRALRTRSRKRQVRW